MHFEGFSFSIPLKTKVSRNKHFILNLNQYRNAHHRVLSSAKRGYTDTIMDLDMPDVRYDKVKLWYRIHPASNRKYDLMNVACILDKFLMDALVKRRIIPDDNIAHVVWPDVEARSPDKENPRAEVFVQRLA